MAGDGAAAALGAAALAVFAPVAARGDVAPERGEAGFALYADSERTQVWSPRASAGADVGGGLTVDADWAADIITSASVDVISAATGRIEEVRHQIGTHAAWDPPGDTSLEGGYTYSFERDAQAHTAQAGARRELLDANLELALRYGLSWTAVGVLGEPRSDWRPAWAHSPEAGVTLSLDRRTEVEALYSAYLVDGYQANPYRRVPVLPGGAAAPLVGMDGIEERVPDRRLRHAWTGRVRRALGRRWVGAADYRLYVDDWGLSAHTVEASAAVEAGRGLEARARQRVTIQNGASFYRERYLEETRYRTRDRRLAPMLATLGGVAVSWERRAGALGRVGASVGVDLIAFRHDRYLAPEPGQLDRMEALGWITGTVVQVGLEVQP